MNFDANLCPWIIYLDKALVTSTSRVKVHPVYLICAALPQKLRYHPKGRIRWGFINLQENYYKALEEMVMSFKQVERGMTIIIKNQGSRIL